MILSVMIQQFSGLDLGHHIFRKLPYVYVSSWKSCLSKLFQILFEDWFKIQNWYLWKNCCSSQQTSEQEYGQLEGETRGIKLLWKYNLNLPQPLPQLDYLHWDPVWLSGKARAWSRKMHFYLGEKDIFYKMFLCYVNAFPPNIF